MNFWKTVKYRDASEKELLPERKFFKGYAVALFALGVGASAMMQVHILAINLELRIREVLKEKSPSQSTG